MKYIIIIILLLVLILIFIILFQCFNVWALTRLKLRSLFGTFDLPLCDTTDGNAP